MRDERILFGMTERERLERAGRRLAKALIERQRKLRRDRGRRRDGKR